MIIKKVRLENFGLYEGVQEFDLTPTDNKNIILIGGKNGNGKTTFFEAIRFCLYGPASFEKRLTSTEYEDFLLGKIHYNPNEKIQHQHASIYLEFEHSSFGSTDNYSILRAWKKTHVGLKEQFAVRRNGVRLGEVEVDQWQEFINDLIPPGLSKLFFFDGEKIQRLASDLTSSKQLAESFKSLLGVDLVEKLQSDLQIYMARQLQKNGTKSLSSDMEALRSKISDIQKNHEILSQERAQFQSQLNHVLGDIDRQEQGIAREGGTFASKRDELKIEGKTLEFELKSIEEQLRTLSAGLLPVIFAPTLSKKLETSLQEEQDVKLANAAKKLLSKRIGSMKKKFSKPEFWEGSSIRATYIPKVSQNILSTIKDALFTDVKNSRLTHNLSESDHQQLLSQITQASSMQLNTLNALSKHHEQVSRKAHKVQKQLSYAPETSALSKYIDKIKLLHHKMGTIEKQIEVKDKDMRQLEFEREREQRQLDKLLEVLENQQDLSHRLQLVKKAQTVLTKYRDRLQESKIEEFSKTLIEFYELLARKKGLFHKVAVNPQTYEVTLYKKGKSGIRKLSKKELSAGEKQIYAIAVLWTLTKLSRRPLPFIIDTPLGRLDVDHREHLASKFFPDASHQLIILSTDTEIDRRYVKRLEPHIARKYHLHFEDGKTTVNEGYFWEVLDAKV